MGGADPVHVLRALAQRPGEDVQVVVLADDGLLPRQVILAGVGQLVDRGQLGDDGPLPGVHVLQGAVLGAERVLPLTRRVAVAAGVSGTVENLGHLLYLRCCLCRKADLAAFISCFTDRPERTMTCESSAASPGAGAPDSGGESLS